MIPLKDDVAKRSWPVVTVGLICLNVLVFLCFWNAMKFAWMAVLSVPLMLGRALAR